MKYTLLLSILLSFMSAAQSIDHKISQMLMVGFPGTDLSDTTLVNDISLRKIGGVILLGYNIASPSQISQLTHSLQSLSETPLFISVDQEGGRIARLRASNGFSATKTAYEIGTLINDEDTTRTWASLMSGWLSESGFNLNLAPVTDVNVNPNSPAIGMLDRSFSAVPDSVYYHAKWFIEEFNSKNIFTTLKHFPGHGSADVDSHLGFTDITNTWSVSELIPYQFLIQDGYQDFIMSGHLYNANLDSLYPASLSSKVMTDLLRNTLGFDGIIITDGMFMGAITNNYSFDKAVELAVNAGNDILLYTSNRINGRSLVDSIVTIVKSKISEGIIPESRIDQSYQRIIQKKQILTGIFSDSDESVPSGFSLMNYPNPFNSSTRVYIETPVDGNLSVKVYNIIGEEVAEIFNDHLSSGSHTFEFNAGSLSSGIYLVKMSIAGYSAFHKIVLMK